MPPLSEIARYGNVRQTDAALIGVVVHGLVARTCIGLSGACASLNDEAAEMFTRIVSVNGALALLQDGEHLAMWHNTLKHLTEQNNLHGLVAGRCCRLLFEAEQSSPDDAARRLSWALSTANEPAQAAWWLEGFLRDSGLVLFHDEVLRRTLDDWVSQLRGEDFITLLPLLRRTFATFTAPERRQMGERVKQERSNTISAPAGAADFVAARAAAVLPLLAQLLGVWLDEAAERRGYNTCGGEL